MALAPLVARTIGAATLELFRPEEEQSQTVHIEHVDSSCITTIGWNPPGTISVTFKRGGSINYDYSGTYEQFIAFREAPSKGAFFNANFR